MCSMLSVGLGHSAGVRGGTEARVERRWQDWAEGLLEEVTWGWAWDTQPVRLLAPLEPRLCSRADQCKCLKQVLQVLSRLPEASTPGKPSRPGCVVEGQPDSVVTSLPQFPHLSNGDSATYHAGLW
jgi:hypothetical protein